MVGATEGLTLKPYRLRHCVFCCVYAYRNVLAHRPRGVVNQKTKDRDPARTAFFCRCHNSGIDTTLCLMNTEGKATGAWSWPLFYRPINPKPKTSGSLPPCPMHPDFWTMLWLVNNNNNYNYHHHHYSPTHSLTYLLNYFTYLITYLLACCNWIVTRWQ